MGDDDGCWALSHLSSSCLTLAIASVCPTLTLTRSGSCYRIGTDVEVWHNAIFHPHATSTRSLVTGFALLLPTPRPMATRSVALSTIVTHNVRHSFQPMSERSSPLREHDEITRDLDVSFSTECVSQRLTLRVVFRLTLGIYREGK